MKTLRNEYETICQKCDRLYRVGLISKDELKKGLDECWQEYQTTIGLMHDNHNDYMKALEEFGIRYESDFV